MRPTRCGELGSGRILDAPPSSNRGGYVSQPPAARLRWVRWAESGSRRSRVMSFGGGWPLGGALCWRIAHAGSRRCCRIGGRRPHAAFARMPSRLSPERGRRTHCSSQLMATTSSTAGASTLRCRRLRAWGGHARRRRPTARRRGRSSERFRTACAGSHPEEQFKLAAVMDRSIVGNVVGDCLGLEAVYKPYAQAVGPRAAYTEVWRQLARTRRKGTGVTL